MFFFPQHIKLHGYPLKVLKFIHNGFPIHKACNIMHVCGSCIFYLATC